MAQAPFIPRSRTNPIGNTKRIKQAEQAIHKRLRRAESRLIDEIARLPTQRQNGRLRTNVFYEYLISLDVLNALVDALRQDLDDIGQDVLAEMVRRSYREGTAKAVENLARISDDYPRTVTEALRSRPVLRRAALAASRVFESMRGFSGDVAADMSYILFRAIQDGVNPIQVARDIRKRFGIERRRASRIARTEITMAQRRGRWDESRDAEEKFGLEVRLIHYSALIPGRTRATHAQRHGRIVTPEEQAEWYEQDGNGINCLCSSTEITLDKDGQPLFGDKLLERLDKQRKAFVSSGAGEG